MRATHNRVVYGGAKAQVLEALEAHIGEDMTKYDVARRAGVAERTAERLLRELREEGLAFSRRAVTLDRCPLVWGRVAI